MKGLRTHPLPLLRRGKYFITSVVVGVVSIVSTHLQGPDFEGLGIEDNNSSILCLFLISIYKRLAHVAEAVSKMCVVSYY
jgi:hypothetical protein